MIGNTKLFEAVSALVTNKGDVRHRVALACQIIEKMHANELEPDLKERIDKVKNAAGSNGPLTSKLDNKVLLDKYENSIKYRANKTHVPYAEEIFSIWRETYRRKIDKIK
jgi:hypothetical protein